MALSRTEVIKLKQLIRIASDLLESAVSADRVDAVTPARKAAGPRMPFKGGTRRRRSGAELVAFRKMLKAERKKGVPVAELARTHGISTAYIYSIE